MRLGHCICDPRRPCPCDVFRDQSLCPCAGERPDPVDFSQLKLTSLVRNAGCASKISPADLEAVLKRLPEVNDPAVISGLAAADDAAIYRIADNLCLVQTVDVFTPCVDDPHLFGRICAANCLSDIYAMGGEPRTALSILAFPSETLDGEIMYHMLAGAMETLAQAGVALVGGHSIKDDEIKLGFAITGLIDPAVAAALEHPARRRRARVDQAAGNGRAGVLRAGRARPRGQAWPPPPASMATLNQAAAEAMKAARRLGLHGRDRLWAVWAPAAHGAAEQAHRRGVRGCPARFCGRGGGLPRRRHSRRGGTEPRVPRRRPPGRAGRGRSLGPPRLRRADLRWSADRHSRPTAWRSCSRRWPSEG